MRITKDPRSIAREIPGIFDALFPQLMPGLITHINKQAGSIANLQPIPDELIQASSLQCSMLFEIGFAKGEKILIEGSEPDWNECIAIAIERQKNYFDAQPPHALSETDIKIADWVANNLSSMLGSLKKHSSDGNLVCSPKIPGYQWIASGCGDFSLEKTLIEVKCTSRSFGSADYRQVLMYWLLSYISVMESGAKEWERVILLNPRKNNFVEISFNELIELTAAKKSKIDIVELFSSMVGDYAVRALPEFNF